MAGRTLILPKLPVGEFGDDVEVSEVSEVASVFLDQMEQDAFERRGVGTVPAGTRFAQAVIRGRRARSDDAGCDPGPREAIGFVTKAARVSSSNDDGRDAWR